MCGRPVSEWLATTLSYSVVSLHPQNLFPFRMTISLGKRKKLQGTKSGKSVAVLGQKLPSSQGQWTWRIAVV